MFYIKQKVWDKILGYAEEAYNEHKSEIGGMSVMVEDKDGDWELQDVVILKQEISSGNTVLEKDALAEYYTKKAMKMGKKNFRFCWWHSHHTMSAFWSGTDITAIDEFNEGDFSFALVINLKGEYKFRVSVWKPVEVHEDVELEIIDTKNKCTKKMKEEVAELCSKPTATYSNYGSWKKPGSTWNDSKTPYSYGYKSHERLLQEAANDPRQESLFNASFVDNDEKKTFNDVVDDVDELNGDLIEGTISYPIYKESIEELNKELDKENSLYKVELLPEGKKEEILYRLAASFVLYKESGAKVDDYYYGGMM